MENENKNVDEILMKKRRKSKKGKSKIWQENRGNFGNNSFINFRNYNFWNDV